MILLEDIFPKRVWEREEELFVPTKKASAVVALASSILSEEEWKGGEEAEEEKKKEKRIVSFVTALSYDGFVYFFRGPSWVSGERIRKYFEITAVKCRKPMTTMEEEKENDGPPTTFFHLQDPKWGEISTRLSRPVDVRRRLPRPTNRCDYRTGFVLDGREFFLNGMFTFGARTVAEGTRHVYHLTEAPVFLHVLERGGAAVTEKDSGEGRGGGEGEFWPRDRRFYQSLVMKPNERYAVPSGTTYLVTTSRKTSFVLQVVSEALAARYSFSEPVEQKKKRKCILPRKDLPKSRR